ncbi:MAG: MMPL family transporter [Prevotella sp.]|nr:MMPL family transporter [Prevotella sp.]
MTEQILRVYDYLRAHRRLGGLLFVVLTAVLFALVSRMRFQEDITAFLPLDSHHREAVSIYQSISGGNRIFAIVQCTGTTNADTIVKAVDAFVAAVRKADTTQIARQLTCTVDLEEMSRVSHFVYDHIPYFLTDADYHRMDSLLSHRGYMQEQLERDKQMLLFPSGGLLEGNLSRDPLNLFTPVVERLQQQSAKMKYELYGGYIFSPDMKRAFVMITSPFGSSETDNNGRLVDLLQHCADKTKAEHPGIGIHLTGGPVIAVGNARQIKTDSLLAVSIAVVLILILLALSFRSWKNLLLVAFSIAWGWLFAMAGLSLVHRDVSVIVIGISSVIIGIAVNYPLHVIAHLNHTPDMRQALREIVMPLLVGNITTVGAFLALAPLQSVALRDLGLFASFLLVGTIFFVLVFLPQVARVRQHHEPHVLQQMGNFSMENKRWVVATVIVLTAFFAVFAFRTGFDTDLSHINYMTSEQKADMAYFAQLSARPKDSRDLFVVASGKTWEEALQHHERFLSHWPKPVHTGAPFLVSKQEQCYRLKLWSRFKARWSQLNGSGGAQNFKAAAALAGFSPDAFDDFLLILDKTYPVLPFTAFAPLTSSVLSPYVADDKLTGQRQIVDWLTVSEDNVEKTIKNVRKASPEVYAFDIQDINSAVANNLSNDFNYIGYACSAIVFFFLWFSMGSIELAALSFLPMAVSWIWILGIMGLTGIDFNIVNVILATFIFGQGDDYTIFMTEGCQYEYTYGKKMLASYKNSIMLSALIMFIGIGTLILARHPALQSLAVVTIVGMFSVIMMAYLFPPLIFKWLVYRSDGTRRTQPITLRNLFTGSWRHEPTTDKERRQAERDRKRYELK